MTEKFFNATDIQFGFCPNTDCRAVHIHLLDAGGVTRAQAVIACENIEQFVADIRAVRDLVPGAGTSRRSH